MLGCCAAARALPLYTFANYAGNPTVSGTNDGTGSAAGFDSPAGVAVDGSGNAYVADSINDTIREITPGGTVMTIAGTPGVSGTCDGTGSAARFDTPAGVAVDGSGNVYVADSGNNTIREVAPGGVVTTLAGTPELSGTSDGTGSGAQFSDPEGVAVDGSGNVYIADSGNNTIREIAPGGMVSTIAGTAGVSGTGNGTGGAAEFDTPSSVAVDGSGNIYVADRDNDTIREVMPGGIVTTLAGTPMVPGAADGSGTAAGFTDPTGVTVDASGNLYIADNGNNTIREMTPSGMVSTIGGSPGVPGDNDGAGSAAGFNAPSGVAVDGSGNVYVADTGNERVTAGAPQQITGPPSEVSGTGAVVLGSANPNGSATTVWFDYGTDTTYGSETPSQAIGSGTNFVSVSGTIIGLTAGTTYHYRVDYSNALGSFQGADEVFVTGPGFTVNPAVLTGTSVELSANVNPKGFAGPPADTANVYVSWQYGLVAGSYTQTTSAQPIGTGATPAAVAISIDDSGLTPAIYHYQLVVSSTLGYSYGPDQTFSVAPPTVACPASVTSSTGAALAPLVNPNGYDTTVSIEYGLTTAYTTGTTAAQDIGSGFTPVAVSTNLTGLAFNTTYHYRVVTTSAMGTVYSADETFTTTLPQQYYFTNYVGSPGMTGTDDGTGASAQFDNPEGVAVDSGGNVYVADTVNNTIREVMPGGVVVTIAGNPGVSGTSDGTGAAAEFNAPSSVAVDGSGNLYVADYNNNTIREIMPGGVVSTIAGTAGVTGTDDGTGPAAEFNGPTGVAVDANGNVYVADFNNCTIREVMPGGVVSTIAGAPGISGTSDGTGSAAHFSYPAGVAVDGSGNVYVADSSNNTIREVMPGGMVSTIAGTAGVTGTGDGNTSAAQFSDPQGVAADGNGNVYIADTGNCTIRKLTPAGVVTTLGGTPGASGASDGAGSAAQFYLPFGVALDSSGNVYVADTSNSRVTVGVLQEVTGGSTPYNDAIGALVNGSANPDGNDTTVWFDYGTDTTYGNQTPPQSIGSGNSFVSITGTLTGLSLNSIYHYCLAVSSSAGTYYGVDQTLNVPGYLLNPAVVTGSSVAFSASVNPGGAAGPASDPANVYVSWQYGLAAGRYNEATPAQPIGTGTSVVLVSATTVESGLPAAIYHYRLLVSSSLGNAYGPDEIFSVEPPTLTYPAAVTTGTGEMLAPTVNPNGLDTMVSIEYGLTTAYTSGTTPAVDIGSGFTPVAVDANLTGLTFDTTYHYSVVTTNALGTFYGADRVFTTSPGFTTNTAGVTLTSVSLSASVNPEGLPGPSSDPANVYVYWQYGLAAGSYTQSTTPQPIGTGDSAVPVSLVMPSGTSSSLAMATYHYQLVISTAFGNAYGPDQTFTTGPAFTPEAAGVSATSVSLAASVNPNGIAGPAGNRTNLLVSWQYGLAAGSYTRVTASQPIGTGSSAVAVSLTMGRTGLVAAIYHYRLLIASSLGNTYGPDETFTLEPPTLSYPAAFATGSGAILSPLINPNGLDTTVYIEYGLTTAYTSGTTPVQDIGSGFSPVPLTGVDLTGLATDTTYHYIVVTTNALGTVYGPDQTFTTGPIFTANAAALTGTSVELRASVNPNGFAGPANDTANLYVSWQYGPSAGDYIDMTAAQPIGTGTSPVPVAITMASGQGTPLGLALYHYQLVISSTIGNIYGPDQLFSTGPSYTVSGPALTGTSVTLAASVNPNALPGPAASRTNVTVSWQYGLVSGTYNRVTALKLIGTGTAAAPVSLTIPKTSLTAGVYNYRLLVSSSLGNLYGPNQLFSVDPPTLAYSPPSSTGTSALLSLTVNPNGIDTTVYIEYGLTTAYSGGVISVGDIGNGYTPVAVDPDITGLHALTEYHFRIVTTGILGTVNGADQTFTTQPLFSTAAFASTRDPATGITGAWFTGFGNPAINALNHFAFQATITGSAGSGIGATNNSGIWAGIGAAPRVLIARTGTPAPDYTGASSVGTFASLSDPVYADDDGIAFLGNLVVSGTVTRSNNTGIWATTSGTLALVARTGDAAPDITGATSSGSPIFGSFSQFVLPDQGGVVILANLVNGIGGAVTANNQGIWAVATNGLLTQIVRKGGTLSVNGSTKTISALTIFNAPAASTGQTRHFNNPGDLTYKATFTDRSSSIVQVVFP